MYEYKVETYKVKEAETKMNKLARNLKAMILLP